MGLIDRFAAKVAAEIEKAPRLPAGSVTSDQASLVNPALAQHYGTTTPLPRSPYSASVPFAPGLPLIPGAINPVNPATGRAEPRRYEYQVAQNINVTETRAVSFKTLRSAADQIDILRRCIEVIKSKVTALDWDIVLAADAMEKIAAQSGKDYVRAMADARNKFTPEIDRLRTFWENPDKSNGMTWAEWVSMAIEESLVIDALAIWPQLSVGGELYGLQILDGATIKPLLDDRGMRPLPPNAAYQQILYGFPRTEFTTNDDDPSADGEFTSDDLAYLVRNRRTTSVYGFSPTERALPLADLYLRRQQWIRAEFTDGVTPELFFKTDINWGTNPDLLLAYENILNDELAGQTEQRHRSRLLPAGVDPFQPAGYDQKFNTALDDFLISSICGHYGVQPTEIGYQPKSGLGGAGFEQGKAANAELLGEMPLANWFSKQLTNLSYTFLGMPRELEFKMMPSRQQDTLEVAQKERERIFSGQRTLNEVRANDGKPLLDTPQADMPMIVAGASTYLLAPDGIIDVANSALGTMLDDNLDSVDAAPVVSEQKPAADVPADAAPTDDLRTRAEALGVLIRAGVQPSAAASAVGMSGLQFVEAMPITLKPVEQQAAETAHLESQTKKPDDQSATDVEARNEVKAFMKWAKKPRKDRFKFHHVDETYGETLNKFMEVDDLDAARWYAERYLDLV